MRLSEPRVSTIFDKETGSTLARTTVDNSHDVGGQNYEFIFYDDDGNLHPFEVRTQHLLTAYDAYRKNNPDIQRVVGPRYRVFKEDFYKKNHTEQQVLWFVDEPKVDDITYEEAARVFCRMFLRMEFSYEFNRDDYDPSMEGAYLGKIHFYPSPNGRLSPFEMEVGGDD